MSMAKDKISMPSSMGGLVRYFDEEKTKFLIKPGIVIGIAIVVIIAILVLYVSVKPGV
jgi:preprotein translocase subunit Sec61beta